MFHHARFVFRGINGDTTSDNIATKLLRSAFPLLFQGTYKQEQKQVVHTGSVELEVNYNKS